jgi:hypothetical protein
MNDLIDQSSVQSPMAFSRDQAEFACDALRSGVRGILILGQDSSSAQVPEEALAGCENASVRVLHIRQPLPSLLELQDMIAGAAGVTGGLGLAPQAMARLLLTSVPPWESVILAIDDAEALPRQSLYYLAQVSAALPADARVFQIVLAGGPALLERLDHPDFATFRNSVAVANEKNSEQEEQHRMKNRPAQARSLQLVAPRPVQLPSLPEAPLRPAYLTSKAAHRLTGDNLLVAGLMIGYLLAIALVAFLAYSADQTRSSVLPTNANTQQEFALAPQTFPPAPPDAGKTDEAIASLIGQLEAAMARELSAPRPRGEAANLANRIEVLADGASPSGRLMVFGLKDRIAERVIEALRAGRSDEAHRLEQFLGRSGNSRSDSGRVLAADSPGASSNGTSPNEVTAVAHVRPNDRGEAQTGEKSDQPITFPDLVLSRAAPETAAGLPLTGTQRPQAPAAQDKAVAPVSADLPAYAPFRVVLTYPRDNKAAASRTAALQQALQAAKVEVGNLEATDASLPAPSIGYYFRSDRNAAVDISHKVEPLLGPIEPIMLEPRGEESSPGTIVIALPGHGSVLEGIHRNHSNKPIRHVRTSDLVKRILRSFSIGP